MHDIMGDYSMRMKHGSTRSIPAATAVLLTMAMTLVLSLAAPRLGGAAPCTRGTNCYCDRVRNGDLKDSSLLLCEDFEAPTLHDNVSFGGGAPDYGPWYDYTGWPNNGARGFNSYWQRNYGPATDGCAWQQGQPGSPTVGSTCSYQTCFAGQWNPSDVFQANSFACMTVVRNGEFGAEIATISPPTGSAGGGSGVFDGSQSMGFRVPQGHTAGIMGVANWTPVTTFGATFAIAFPSNSNASGIWGGPWKGNEWVSVDLPNGGPASYDGLLVNWNQNGRYGQAPFTHFVFYDGDTQASCQAKLNAATKTVGDFRCLDGGFNFFADLSVYNQPVDWPDGTWGCVQGYFQNLGTNSSIQIWFTGPSGIQKKIIDISGMDLSGTSAKSGYRGRLWNAYANTNQGAQYGYTASAQTTFRYEDNVHIRAGAPVSCSQIGFSASSGSGGPPAAPTGLTVH
jgi:hypothetical protein